MMEDCSARVAALHEPTLPCDQKSARISQSLSQGPSDFRTMSSSLVATLNESSCCSTVPPLRQDALRFMMGLGLWLIAVGAKLKLMREALLVAALTYSHASSDDTWGPSGCAAPSSETEARGIGTSRIVITNVHTESDLAAVVHTIHHNLKPALLLKRPSNTRHNRGAGMSVGSLYVVSTGP